MSHPTLIDVLNATKYNPYRISLHRPVSLGVTALEYSFNCKPYGDESKGPHSSTKQQQQLPVQSNPSAQNSQFNVDTNNTSSNGANVIANSNQSCQRFKCRLTIRKLITENGGLQHTERKLEHTIYLIEHRKNQSWIWLCEALNQDILLNPPVQLLCRYSKLGQYWFIETNQTRDVNALFTMNLFGDGLGLFAHALADKHEIRFFTRAPTLQIECSWKGVPVTSSKVYHHDELDAQQNDDDAFDEENPKISIENASGDDFNLFSKNLKNEK